MTTLIIRSVRHLFSATSEVCLTLGSVIIQGRRITINHLNLINGCFLLMRLVPTAKYTMLKSLSRSFENRRSVLKIAIDIYRKWPIPVAAHSLELRVRLPPGARMFVPCYYTFRCTPQRPCKESYKVCVRNICVTGKVWALQ